MPVLDGEGVSIYYGGSHFSHKGGEEGNPYEERIDRFYIGLACSRKDGFIYASSPASDEQAASKLYSLEVP